MINGLTGLRHYPVISTYNEYYDVGNACSSCPHLSESLMAGRIEEHNLLTVLNYDVCSDVLSNSSGFVCGNTGVPDVVEEGRLAMIDVSHYSDYWGTFDQCFSLPLKFALRLRRL